MSRSKTELTEMKELLVHYAVLCVATGFRSAPLKQLKAAIRPGNRKEFITFLHRAWLLLACYGMEHSHLREFWAQAITDFYKEKTNEV